MPAEDAAKFDAPFNTLPMLAREQLWRAYVWHLLDTRVSPAAAETYATAPKTSTRTRITLSAASACSASWSCAHSLRISPAIGWVAKWNAWAWRPDERAAAELLVSQRAPVPGRRDNRSCGPSCSTP